MPRLVALWLLLAASYAPAAPPDDPAFWGRFRGVIQSHLGRPYVWGASGLKSFDCSGFVWRVMYENGLYMKRTTARKLYMSLPVPKQGDQWTFGNVVFFDNLKHCGIVNGKDSFYHAQTSRGTNLSELNSFWRRKVCGVRRIGR